MLNIIYEKHVHMSFAAYLDCVVKQGVVRCQIHACVVSFIYDDIMCFECFWWLINQVKTSIGNQGTTMANRSPAQGMCWPPQQVSNTWSKSSQPVQGMCLVPIPAHTHAPVPNPRNRDSTYGVCSLSTEMYVWPINKIVMYDLQYKEKADSRDQNLRNKCGYVFGQNS